jgi:hypothetical protein
MSVNKFLQTMIDKMSFPIPRLRKPEEQITVILQLYTEEIFQIISFILIKKSEYKYNWSNIKTLCYQNNYTEDNELKKYINYLKEMSINCNAMNFEEADWIDDAVHEILIDE